MDAGLQPRSGDLPLTDLPKVTGDDNEPLSILRCRLESAAAGSVKFKLNSVAGLRIWVTRSRSRSARTSLSTSPPGNTPLSRRLISINAKNQSAWN